MTPLMKQYWEVKSAHQDKVLLFRMGDFFEIFHQDAITAAPILGIALTKRNQKSSDETPMCGVPHHSIAQYINKLLKAGLKVAICDQVEDPKQAKGIVKRAVTRILSPGMVFDSNTLDALQPNYVAALDSNSISFADASTGEAFYYLAPGVKQKKLLLQVLNPVEIVLAPHQSELKESLELSSFHLTEFDRRSGKVDSQIPESAVRLAHYVEYMQGLSSQQVLRPFEKRQLVERLEMSANVLRHLEVFQTYRNDPQGSLFAAINRTLTPGGARLLRSWLAFPLASQELILERQKQVDHWVASPDFLKSVRSKLKEIGDLERRASRILQATCTGRDLNALAVSLAASQEVLSHIRSASVFAGSEILDLDSVKKIEDSIVSTIVDEPPVGVKDGHLIRSGVSRELDELVQLSTDGQSLLLKMEAQERERTGISSLKIRYNNIFGYSIEVTNAHKTKVPSHYRRKQTLAQAERYVTDELEALETKVLSARTRRLEMEYQIYENLRQSILIQMPLILSLAQQISRIDVTSALAWLAIEAQYCRPEFRADGGIELKASRHPVVEKLVSRPFVANDLKLESAHCMLLTGPNMAGKSTLMRQVALTVMLAQIGSYVPAQEAKLPIFDKLFTRIGANDSLTEGLSTFMVEMKETAELLREAGESTLVILDEIGRGTSTFDGMSLAQAILEFLVVSTRATTLFATHYQELTQLASVFPQIKNHHMAIRERAGQLSFLYTLQQGPVHRSYGIHVAELAGLPSQVVHRAKKILEENESRRAQAQSQLSLFSSSSPSASVVPDENSDLDVETFSTVDPIAKKLAEELRGISVEKTTPLEALSLLAKWRESLS